MIRDQLVVGILDKELSWQLQLKSNLTLEGAIQTIRNSKQIKQQVNHQKDFKGLQEISQTVDRGGFKPFPEMVHQTT